MCKGAVIAKFSYPITLVTLVLSVLGAYFSSKLTLQSDLAQLLPENFESVQALNRMKEEMGGVSNLRVVVECSDYAALVRFANDFAEAAEADTFVNYVDFTNEVGFYKRNGLLFLTVDELESLRQSIEDKVAAEKQKLNPLFVDDLFGEDDEESTDDFADLEEKYRGREPTTYHTNADSTVLVIKLFPKTSGTSLSYGQNMVRSIRNLVDSMVPGKYSPDLNVYLGGSIKNRIDEYNVIIDDILGTAYYGLGGVLFLIIIYFRKLAGAFLITVSLVASLTWTFGLTYLVIGNLNTITGFLFVILFGLGIDYGIHAFARYVESRRNGLDLIESVNNLVEHTGRALTTTAVTTSAAFFSLTIMDFRGFSDLGFISGVGILFALVGMVVVLPALIVIFDRMNWLTVKARAEKSSTSVPRSFPYSSGVLVLSGLLTVAAAYGATKVVFEYDFTNLRAITEERKQVSRKTDGVFDLSESPAVVLASSKAEISEVVDAVQGVMASDTVTPTIKTVRTVYSLVPEDQKERLVKIGEIRQLVHEEADGVLSGPDEEKLNRFRQYLEVSQPFTWDDFPVKDKRQFVNKRGEIGNFVFIYPSVALRDGKNAIDFRDDVGQIVTGNGKTYHASSSNIILADMLTIMIGEGRWAVGLTFLVVFTIVFLDFRNIKATVLILSPLMLGVLWTVATMYLFDLKWNLFNIVVIPSIIGIGVDNGVHIYHRYTEEGPGSLMHVLRHTGLAILMTTLTTIVGYSGLVAAHHPGLNSIGKLALVGISLTFVTAVVFLPAALRFLEKRTERSASVPA